MLKSLKKKKNRIILLTILVFSIIFSAGVSNFVQYPGGMNSVEKDNETDVIDKDNTSILKTSQLDDFEGNGTEVNIALQESLVDTTTKNFGNLDASNSFTEPSPIFSGFNTTFTNIDIENIIAPDKYIVIESGSGSSESIDTYDWAFSFEMRGRGTLDNLSMCFSENQPTVLNATIGISIYDAVWDQPEQAMKPGIFLYNINTNYQIDDGSTAIWYNLTNINRQLDPTTETNNNTYFIFINQNTAASQASVRFHYVTDGGTDDSLTWQDWGAGTWALNNYDPSMKLNFLPLDNTPTPSDVNLTINSIEVNDISSNNEGNWNTTQGILEDLSGDFEINLTADWWDVSCDVTSVQINYTKSDLNINASYLIPDKDTDVQWTVDAGTLNYFDSRITHTNTINFTIPSEWQNGNIQVFNDSLEKTPLVIQDLGNGLKDIMVSDGGNGTNWYLTAITPNLLDGLITEVNTFSTEIMNYTNVIDFTTNFIETVHNGTIGLEIYSLIPHYLNHTQSLNISSSDISYDMVSWDISTSLEIYGVFSIQLTWANETAAGLFEKNITIMAEIDLVLTSPNNIEIFDDQLFNVTVFYNNTGENEGILDANMTDHSGYAQDWGHIAGGNYYVEFNSTDFSYGNNNIEIEAWKDYHYNDSIIFSFNKIRNTSITPEYEPIVGPVIRGQTATYLLEYRYGDSNLSVVGANIIPDGLGIPTGLNALSTIDHSNGSYTIRVDTDNADVSSSPFVCYFKASIAGYESQYINMTVNIIMTQAKIENVIYDNIVTQISGFNETVSFYFNDTINDVPITGLTTGDITVLNATDDSIWDRGDFNWELYDNAGGNYEINISTNNLEIGWHYITINASYTPNYNWTSYNFSFYFSGNETQVNLVSVSHLVAGVLTLSAGNYTFFADNDLQITLNISALNNLNLLIEGEFFTFTINYTNYITSFQGTIANTIVEAGSLYQGSISTSSLNAGYYNITIFANRTGYETESYSFNLTIEAKYQVRITALSPPTEVTAGKSFYLRIFCEYNDGTQWLPFGSQQTSLSVIFDLVGGGTTSPTIPVNNTDSNGIVWFQITLTTDVTNITAQASIIEEYDHETYLFNVPDITINPSNTGIPFEDLIIWIILILAVALIAVMGVVGYRKVVIPQKRRKEGVLDEVKTVFDDAVNIEHILVLYKGSGTCIFFKSYGSEKIDPDLISGFISAVSSFGKEVESQKALNEITYEDKMLLLADGQYIRVALVLSKKASIFLRGKLREFIKEFEQRYNSALPKWRGQLNVFKNAGPLIDESFKTSIILPHQIQYNQKAIKNLRIPTSKEVLSNTKNLMNESGRDFVFISKLLDKTLNKSTKGIAKVFMGIKELRESRILVPIDISSLDRKAISPQERQMIEQKICQFVVLPREEQQQMIEQLVEMTPEEREVYLASLQEKKEIVSAPIKSKIGGKVVENENDASKQIKILINKAKKEKKVFSYKKAVIYYEEAAIIATNWDLKRIIGDLQEAIRLSQIDELTLSKKEIQEQGQRSIKQKNYQEAALKFKQAADLASQIFKLGVNEMQEEVKRLTIASKKVEKL